MINFKFSSKKICCTAIAAGRLVESGQDPWFFLAKHFSGDWGEVGGEDWKTNEQALKDGDRLFSVYTTLKNEKIYVITEADRSLTTMMLWDEY